MNKEYMKYQNQQEWMLKLYIENSCPDSCAWRGQPHEHIFEANLIDWDGRHIPDPQFPYELAGREPPC